MIYVTFRGRSGLEFVFIEVKYRRNLRAAREPQLLDRISEQAEIHRQQWFDWYFSRDVAEITAAVRRSRLVRAMQFYLEKANRHSLAADQYPKLRDQIDRLMRDGLDYKFGEPNAPTCGFVFCPELSRAEPELLTNTASGTAIYLFGPSQLPDLVAGYEQPKRDDDDWEPPTQDEAPLPDEPSGPSSVTQIADQAAVAASTSSETASADREIEAATAEEAQGTSPLAEGAVETVAGSRREPIPALGESGLHSLPKSPQSAERQGAAEVAQFVLGTDKFSETEVAWHVTSRANPHLMIVGLPGMGKTEALLNICQQLVAQSITPIVFSYHPDIDERLEQKLGQVQLLDHRQLGFNPMHVDDPTPHAHIDNAGMLRDIFAAMFPDLGDVQLERIRSAIRESYNRLGWGKESESPREIPEFRAFYELLQQDAKGNQNVLVRLNELNDYGVFETSGAVRSLLASNTPSVLRIHATQNDGVQRAVAMLALYNIYKEMFRRGVQPRITHAVVFDEAHRASRLRLLPRLAAECRKFGLSLILASQSARDFDPGLYSQIASYLLLRMTEQDANVLSKNITTSDQSRRVADRLKQLEKYHALFFREGVRQPNTIALSPP